jgi:hypothetical protein
VEVTDSYKVTLIITTVKSFIVQALGDKNLNVGMKQNAHLNHQQVGTFFKHFFEKKSSGCWWSGNTFTTLHFHHKLRTGPIS